MNNVMIDLETLGTAANSVILSVGAVRFTADGLSDEFYVDVSIDSCLDQGLKIEGRTLAWWMGQSDEARSVFGRTGLALPVALAALSSSFDWEGTKVWCNGLNFDLPILDTAYRACGMGVPWAYYNARDYRTVKYELPKETFRSLEVKPTVAHNALEDAKAQALTLLAIRAMQREHCPLQMSVRAAPAA